MHLMKRFLQLYIKMKNIYHMLESYYIKKDKTTILKYIVIYIRAIRETGRNLLWKKSLKH